MTSFGKKIKSTRILIRKRATTQRPFSFNLQGSNQLSGSPKNDKKGEKENSPVTNENSPKGKTYIENKEVLPAVPNKAQTSLEKFSRLEETKSKNQGSTVKESVVNTEIVSPTSITPSLDTKKKPVACRLVDKFNSASFQTVGQTSDTSDIMKSTVIPSANHNINSINPSKNKSDQHTPLNEDNSEAIEYEVIKNINLSFNTIEAEEKCSRKKESLKKDKTINTLNFDGFKRLNALRNEKLNFSDVVSLENATGNESVVARKLTLSNHNSIKLISPTHNIQSASHKSPRNTTVKTVLEEHLLVQKPLSPTNVRGTVSPRKSIDKLVYSEGKGKRTSRLQLENGRSNENLALPRDNKVKGIDVENGLFPPLKRKHLPLSQESIKMLKKMKGSKVIFEVEKGIKPAVSQISRRKPKRKPLDSGYKPEAKKVLMWKGLSKRSVTDVTDLEVGFTVVTKIFNEFRGKITDDAILEGWEKFEKGVIKEISTAISKTVGLQKKRRAVKKLTWQIKRDSQTLGEVIDEKIRKRETVVDE